MSDSSIKQVVIIAILTCTASTEIRTSCGQEEANGKPAPVFGIDYSPDGRWLAASGGMGTTTGSLAVWNIADWKPHLVRVELQGIGHIGFSPDGKQLAYTTGEMAVFMDVATWKEIDRWKAGQARLHSIAYSPDGTQFATSGADGTIKVWNAKTVMEVESFKAHKEDAYHAAYSPDGTMLLSGGGDGKAILWDLKTFQPKQTFEPSKFIVRRIRWSKDSRYFLTSRWDGHVRIRDTATGTLLGYTRGGSRWADLSQDNRLLVTTGRQNTARLHRVNLSSPTSDQAKQIRQLITKFEDDDYQTRETAQKQIAEFGMVAVPILREFADSSDAEIRIRTRILRRELMSPEPIAELSGHRGDVEVACFSPDGKQIATGCRGGDVKVWDASTFEKQITLQLPRVKPGEEHSIP
jgi:WD40 repeat protein